VNLEREKVYGWRGPVLKKSALEDALEGVSGGLLRRSTIFRVATSVGEGKNARRARGC